MCHRIIIQTKANEEDFLFLKSCVINPTTPDFSGYNTRTTSETGQSLKAKSKVYYHPLINKTLADPSTILTAMCNLEKISKDAGQSFSMLTSNQQLFRVMLYVIWENPPRWVGSVQRIGGMHWIMSFVGSAGKLVENSGLAQLMMSSFAGVEKMLTGKKFPMNIRALRFVVAELLHSHMEGMLKYHDLSKFLEVSAKSNLAEHWVCNLIKPVLLMMLYVRAEKEWEFALHLDVCKRMLPYFLAASHWNYARDGIAYVQMMENVPGNVLNPLMKGEHVVRLREGLWNAIWMNIAIESTYMRMGKGPSGLIGVTTQERTVKVWANGDHLCKKLLSEIDTLGNSDNVDRTKHKKEGDEKIKADQLDRERLQNTLEKCIHPLSVDTH